MGRGLRATPAAAADPWAYGFAVVPREGRSVIGTVGFKGPPDAAGVVEVAYGIVPAFRGQGYATEAATAAVEFAFADARVRRARAHTLPTPNASTRVLARCGFERTPDVVDPDDGPVWRWERGRGVQRLLSWRLLRHPSSRRALRRTGRCGTQLNETTQPERAKHRQFEWNAPGDVADRVAAGVSVFAASGSSPIPTLSRTSTMALAMDAVTAGW